MKNKKSEIKKALTIFDKNTIDTFSTMITQYELENNTFLDDKEKTRLFSRFVATKHLIADYASSLFTDEGE